jgi:hypothetical protein
VNLHPDGLERPFSKVHYVDLVSILVDSIAYFERFDNINVLLMYILDF